MAPQVVPSMRGDAQFEIQQLIRSQSPIAYADVYLISQVHSLSTNRTWHQ
jgi:hypothetical protein